MNIPVDQVIVTSIVTAVSLIIVQGLARKFFEKGSIMDEKGCLENRADCLKERNKELAEIKERLDKREITFKHLEISSKIQSMALLELCKEKGLTKSVEKLEELLEGRIEVK